MGISVQPTPISQVVEGHDGHADMLIKIENIYKKFGLLNGARGEVS